MKTHSLPLGIDIGTTGIRIAEMISPGAQLRNVVTASLAPNTNDEQVAATLRSLVAQLHTRERRCVLLLDDRNAVVREVRFPQMSRLERTRAARIEAARFAPADAPCTIGIAKTAENSYAVTAAVSSSLDRLVSIVRAAKLRMIAVDHASYAFGRAFTRCDAVVDVGLQQTRFYALKAAVPFSHVLDIGGAHFTEAVARAFAIDTESAEGRKRLHGIAPAGETELAAIVHFIGRSMRSARAAGVADIERIVVTGNGARIPQLASKIERDTGCLVEIATRFFNGTNTFPDDIVRAAAPEWGLAYGAVLWSIAEDLAA